METEATHVTRMQNRRTMIIMIIPGAISQRGIKSDRFLVNKHERAFHPRKHAAGLSARTIATGKSFAMVATRRPSRQSSRSPTAAREAASSRRRRTARHVACEAKHTQNEYFQYIQSPTPPVRKMSSASSLAITAAPVMKPRHRPEGDQVDVGGAAQSQPSHCLRKTYSRMQEAKEAEVRQRTCTRGEALPPYLGSWSSDQTVSGSFRVRLYL